MKPKPRHRALDLNNNCEQVCSDPENGGHSKEGTVRTKQAMKMRRYRRNVKNDSERLAKAREKDRLRKQECRAKQKQEIQHGNLTLQAEIRKQTNKHMIAYRKRTKPTKVKRKQKSKHQANAVKSVSPKQDHRKKATLRTQNWRLRVQLKTSSKTDATNQTEVINVESENQVASPSRWTVKRGLKRVKSVLPNTPAKKLAIVERLIESPTTASHLNLKGVMITPEAKKKLDMVDTILDNFTDTINELKPSGSQTQHKKSAYDTIVTTTIKSVGKSSKLKSVLKKLKMGKNTGKLKEAKQKKAEWWKPNPRKARKDKITDEVKQRVHEFYLSQEVSRVVPNKKDVTITDVGDKELVQRHVMHLTSADAFSMYRSNYQNDKLGHTSFKKLKPKHVKNVSETSRKSCLCQICCNVALKMEAIKSYGRKHLDYDILKTCDKTSIVEATLCETGEGTQHKNRCLNRECEHCGVNLLDNYMKSVTDKQSADNADITWNKWDYITIEKEEGTKRIISCVPKTSSFEEFLEELKKDMKEYPIHKFRASWQQQQMTKNQQSLENGHIMMVMDFAENYKCSFQNEVQSAYFDQNLVTLHPSMNYYSKNIDGQDILVKHSIIGISNDLKHDSHLVKAFEQQSMEILNKNTALNVVHQWSDGCAAQYKGKISFAYLGDSHDKRIRNFFETSHGKNVCDGLGAIVKNSCYRAMLTGKVIGNAKDVHTHCVETLAHGLKLNAKVSTATIREFTFINKTDVDHTRFPNAKTLVGTRKLHTVRNTDARMIVESRNLSCYCKGCNLGDTCDNVEYVQNWRQSDLRPKSDMETTFTEVEGTDRAGVTANAENGNALSSIPPSNTSRPAPILTPGQLECDESGNPCEEPSVDNFVMVAIHGTRSSKQTFVGQVLDVDNKSAEVKISYMKSSKYGRQTLYFWPDICDVSWESMSAITKILDKPELSKRSTNRKVLFEFKQ